MTKPKLKIVRAARPAGGASPALDRPADIDPDVGPPDHLDPIALAEWARMMPLLLARGVMTEGDRPALALYCSAFERYVLACRSIRKLGLVIETDLGGSKANPALGVAKGAEATMIRVLAEFGLTPASRSKAAPPAGPPKDELGEFLAAGKGG